MQIQYYEKPDLEESRVDIFYNEYNEEIESLAAFLEKEQVLLGTKEKQTCKFTVSEVYYLEIVDRRCFAYLDKEVYQLELNLKSFLERYERIGFLQIGKSTIVNIRYVNHILPDLNMRLNLVMENGEKLVVNRSYKKAFMDGLKKAE
ncbi:MAG: LytTR family transcriptional regulator DNA-binding domain-containing protein [Lachnospiraceae bacterium]|nr:LytTR family transcriptional regulator DNA-binding domain-containing protein [Lachnospiraceae bacterium]